MKKNLLYLLALVFGFASCDPNAPDEKNYVDLGLSSGIYWQVGFEPEMYNFDEAVAKYGSNLPTVSQYKELLTECKWAYKKGEGYIVTGPNGNKIKFAFNGMDGTGGGASGVGELGMYWTSQRDDALSAFSLSMDFNGVAIQSFFSAIRESVKLVKQSWEIEEEKEEEENPEGSEAKTVDLGLPSKTKWYSQNEKQYTEYFTLQEARAAYGNKVPTYAYWKELMDYCTWTWTGKGYKVTGGNGNSIMLPAAGYKETTVVNQNQAGYYIIADYSDRVLAFDKDKVEVAYLYGDYRYSVRLIDVPSNPQSDKKQCWKMLYEGTVAGYKWATESEINALCQSLTQQYGVPFHAEKTADNDQNSCEAHNGGNPDPSGDPEDDSWDDFRMPNPNITGTINYNTGTLTVSGNGEMYNTSIDSEWYAYRNDVKHVVIENGVTSIAHHAFKDFQYLETIEIPASVTRIGKYAFERCYKLQDVTLPTGMVRIRNNAFKDCQSLAFIKVRATTPPSIESNDAFMDYHYNNVPLLVPSSARPDYQKHNFWGRFVQIEPL